MKTIIIEDEKLAMDRLEAMLGEIDPSIEVVARLASVDASVRWLTCHTADLIFMDIRLSDGLSFSIFDAVEVTTPVIFTTGFDTFAIAAFKVNSIDYLLKPIRIQDLRASLKKFRSTTGAAAARAADWEELLRTLRPAGNGYKQRFLIQFGETIRKVQTGEIAYFYALEKNVFCATFGKHTYPIDYTLDKMETLLDPSQFFRINRKMIVNFTAIATMIPFSRSRLKLGLSPECPKEIEPLVSIERSAAFKEWMDK